MSLEEAINFLTSPNFCKLQSKVRSAACEIIAQDFCEQLHITYLSFIVEDFKNKTDGNYSARKEELKLNAHFFEDKDNSYTNGEPLGLHLLMKIFHEYMHYYQHLQTKDLQESEMYKELIDPITDDVFYHLQETELNANEMSIRELKKCAKLISSSALRSFAISQEIKQRDDIRTAEDIIINQLYDIDRLNEYLEQLRPYYSTVNEIEESQATEFNYKFRKYNLTINETENGSKVFIENKNTKAILSAYIKDDKCFIFNSANEKEELEPLGNIELSEIINILEEYIVALNKCNLEQEKPLISKIDIIPIDLVYDRDQNEEHTLMLANRYNNIPLDSLLSKNLIKNVERFILYDKIRKDKNMPLESKQTLSEIIDIFKVNNENIQNNQQDIDKQNR